MSATSEPRLVDVRHDGEVGVLTRRREAKLAALSLGLQLELRPALASEEARRIMKADKVEAVLDAPRDARPQAMLGEAHSRQAALAAAGV
ncbi:MAG TPA: hypothetical protein VG073_01950 [Gaiellaceae bacterium]|nr:hypothetical protein [Gaiellaceae bacterium]